MGQGQEEAARLMLAEGLSKGQWVMIQNCHLSGENDFICFNNLHMLCLHIRLLGTTSCCEVN